MWVYSAHVLWDPIQYFSIVWANPYVETTSARARFWDRRSCPSLRYVSYKDYIMHTARTSGIVLWPHFARYMFVHIIKAMRFCPWCVVDEHAVTWLMGDSGYLSPIFIWLIVLGLRAIRVGRIRELLKTKDRSTQIISASHGVDIMATTLGFFLVSGKYLEEND